eukprot:4304870-Amphidinium_carterae.1
MVPKDKRLDPLDSLDEVMWATLYAGYGGSAYLAFEALKLILQAVATRLGPETAQNSEKR